MYDICMDDKDKRIQELEELVEKLRDKIRELNRKLSSKNRTINRMHRDSFDYVDLSDHPYDR